MTISPSLRSLAPSMRAKRVNPVLRVTRSLYPVIASEARQSSSSCHKEALSRHCERSAAIQFFMSQGGSIPSLRAKRGNPVLRVTRSLYPSLRAKRGNPVLRVTRRLYPVIASEARQSSSSCHKESVSRHCERSAAIQFFVHPCLIFEMTPRTPGNRPC
eukprot:gene24550-29663_t